MPKGWERRLFPQEAGIGFYRWICRIYRIGESRAQFFEPTAFIRPHILSYRFKGLFHFRKIFVLRSHTKHDFDSTGSGVAGGFVARAGQFGISRGCLIFNDSAMRWTRLFQCSEGFCPGLHPLALRAFALRSGSGFLN